VLCQTGSADFPSVLLGDAIFSDVILSARFKPISGQTDRAGGLIFPVQDQNNNYILRANALVNGVILFKYSGGHRSTIQEGSVPVASGQWQVLRVEANGYHFPSFLNNLLVVEATS
jgi:hypothetical protein